MRCRASETLDSSKMRLLQFSVLTLLQRQHVCSKSSCSYVLVCSDFKYCDPCWDANVMYCFVTTKNDHMKLMHSLILPYGEVFVSLLALLQHGWLVVSLTDQSNNNFSSFSSGWFYHAPSKPKPRTGPVPLPPISQIPGLSNLSHLPEEPCKQTWLRSTDSEYVKLAKQGGRPDLLTMMSPKPPSDIPVGYPRCEWFYDSHYDPNPPQLPEKYFHYLLIIQLLFIIYLLSIYYLFIYIYCLYLLFMYLLINYLFAMQSQ